MSIRLKLVITFAAIALIPLLLASGLTFVSYKHSIEDVRLSALQDLTYFKADKIEKYFAGLKSDIEVAQSFYNIKKNLPILIRAANQPANPEFPAAKKMLDDQLQKMQSILRLSNIMLITLDGKIAYVSNPKHYTAGFSGIIPESEKNAFTQGKEGVYFSDVFFNKSEGGRPGMLVTAPAFDFKGAAIGVIAFEVDMEPIYELIGDVTGLGHTGETLLGKKTGDRVVYLNPLRNAAGSGLGKYIKLGGALGGPIQEAVRGRIGSGRLIDYRGGKVIAAWRYMPSLDWGIVAKIDEKEAFAGVTNLRNLAIALIVIVVILSGIAAFSITQSVARPIKILAEGAEVVGKGDLNHKINIKAKDELGQLSTAFNNMTENLKKSEAELRRHRDSLEVLVKERTSDLEASNRDLARSNESLEQFAYVASHDLQEPLRVMSNYSQLIEKRYKDRLDQDANDFIDFIVDAASRMQRLITDLLAYSRVGRKDLVLTEVDFNEVVRKVIYGMSSTIESGGGAVTYDKLPVLTAHETSIMQVFQNLISNALKFRGDKVPKIHISAKKDDGKWLFSVADNGLGIDPQYHERIFQIFQRLHSRQEYSGTGIGLSICKKIVSNYGGRIWVESEAGKGSTFYFTIPA